jgi:hypothetical protein
MIAVLILLYECKRPIIYHSLRDWSMFLPLHYGLKKPLAELHGRQKQDQVWNMKGLKKGSLKCIHIYKYPGKDSILNLYCSQKRKTTCWLKWARISDQTHMPYMLQNINISFREYITQVEWLCFAPRGSNYASETPWFNYIVDLRTSVVST